MKGADAAMNMATGYLSKGPPTNSECDLFCVFFTCSFISVPNTIRPSQQKESLVDTCSSSGSPMPVYAGAVSAS
jgi:hypothetical protein